MIIRVCIPFYSEFEACKEGLKELEACTEHTFLIEPRQGTYIGKTRNHLVNDGKSSAKAQSPIQGVDAFLFIDSDIKFNYALIEQLTSKNVKIATLPYRKHAENALFECGEFVTGFDGEISSHYTVEETGVKKVSWCGSGMMLVKREVFENMEYPWFRHTMVVKGEYQEEMGEDIGFCVGAKNANFNIWCDFNNPVEHVRRTAEQFDWSI